MTTIVPTFFENASHKGHEGHDDLGKWKKAEGSFASLVDFV
jgi:hypothetical protein